MEKRTPSGSSWQFPDLRLEHYLLTIALKQDFAQFPFTSARLREGRSGENGSSTKSIKNDSFSGALKTNFPKRPCLCQRKLASPRKVSVQQSQRRVPNKSLCVVDISIISVSRPKQPQTPADASHLFSDHRAHAAISHSSSSLLFPIFARTSAAPDISSPSCCGRVLRRHEQRKKKRKEI